MEIACHCSSCGQGFKAGARHAGQEIKCPKCSGVIVVPDAQPSEQPAAEQGKKIPPRRPPPLPAANRGKPEANEAAGNLPDIDIAETTQPSPHAQATERARGKPKGKTWLIVGGTVAGTLVLLLVVIAAVSPSGKSTATTLVIEWPEDERADASLTLDNRKMKVAKRGPVKYTVSPGRHKLVLMRRGYSHIKLSATIDAGETYSYRPEWGESNAFAAVPQGWPKPGGGKSTNSGSAAARAGSGPFAGWIQDMEKAKRKAAARNRDVLILFDGSDWCETSIRMGYEVFLQSEFREQADWRFVLVHIDFPKKSAKAYVEDADRNAALAKSFGVDEYPTIILTDSEGRPYAKEEYREGGIETFMERVSFWQSLREQRDKLFIDIEMAEDEAKLEAIEKACLLLRHMRIIRFYGPTLEEWQTLAQRLDPDNEKGSLEVLFGASWMARMLAVEKTDKAEIDRLIAEFEDWDSEHEFKNNDLAALLHLCAARSLALSEQSEAAEEQIERGLARNPESETVLAQLRMGAAAIRGVGVGTGFVVSSDGYVLTNHHVVEDARKLAVRLPNRKTDLPVTVMAQDSERDMALLKFDVPAGVKFKPVTISAVDIGRGARVGAFGFPLSETVGSGLKLTTGVVSATAEQRRDKMMLLDCRVNPGNSGGPLCDSHGSIVGMVTAKSLSSASVESYGMALPGKAMLDFLKQKLPSYRPPENFSTDESLEWDAVDRRVGPTVLMIVRGL